MSQNNTNNKQDKSRGSNITAPKHAKVSFNFRRQGKIKHFIEAIKNYRIIGTGNDKLSIADTNCAKFFAEPFGRNEKE